MALLIWWALVQEQRAEVERLTTAVGQGLSHEIESQLDSYFGALLDTAAFWGRFGRPPRAQWESEVQGLIEQHPGLAAVRWLPPGDGPVWSVAPGERGALLAPAQREEAAAAVAAALEQGAETVVGPFELPGGGTALEVFVPIGGRETGVLSARIRIDEALAPVLRSRAHDYATTLEWRGSRVWASHPDGAPPSEDTPLERVPVRLAFALGWMLSLRPTAEGLAAQASLVPAYVLSAGTVAAALLAAVAFLAQQAAGRNRRLEALNRELQDRHREMERAQDEVRRLNRELEGRVAERTASLNEAIADLEAFNYSVSHDLRSPLGAILNFSALLEEDHAADLDGPGREFLGRIRTSALSAVAMMDGLLAFSRLGRGEVRPERVDVAELVRSVFDDLTAERSLKEAELELGDLPPAHADPTMLRVVVTNLVANALKFARDAEPPRVRVRGERRDGETVYSVCDNGVGFDMRYAHKLFGVFERLHSSEEFEGSGVGLAIVGRVVGRHGGRVWAEGAVGRGACFHFSLAAGD